MVHGTGKMDSEALSGNAYRRVGEGESTIMNEVNSVAMAGEPAGAI